MTTRAGSPPAPCFYIARPGETTLNFPVTTLFVLLIDFVIPSLYNLLNKSNQPPHHRHRRIDIAAAMGEIKQGWTLERGIVSTGRIFHAGNHLAPLDPGARENKMKRSKLLFSMVVAFAVLTLVVTTALAEGELPGRNALMLGGEIVPDVTPWPAMQYSVTYDTTPDFRFTEYVGATKYKVEVYNSYDNSLLYTYKGLGVCTGGYCTLTPDTVLGIYKWNSTVGIYYWRVKAKVGGYWQPSWSGTQYFYVLSEGFVSKFTTDKKGWKAVNGTWAQAAPGYLIGGPEAGNGWYGVFQKNFTWDFIYQVKMKRTTGTSYANSIMFWGFPAVDTAHWNQWYEGVYFQYADNGQWAVWKAVDGSWEFVQSWTSTTYVHPNDWNTLTVVVQFPYQYFYLNGGYMGWLSIEDPDVGYAGIGFYTPNSTDKLLVDKATLEALQTYTFNTPDPGMELGKDPIPEGMVPWEVPGE